MPENLAESRMGSVELFNALMMAFRLVVPSRSWASASRPRHAGAPLASNRKGAQELRLVAVCRGRTGAGGVEGSAWARAGGWELERGLRSVELAVRSPFPGQ